MIYIEQNVAGRSINFLPGLSKALLALSDLYLLQGRSSEALETATEAQRLTRKLKRQFDFVDIQRRTGEAMMQPICGRRVYSGQHYFKLYNAFYDTLNETSKSKAMYAQQAEWDTELQIASEREFRWLIALAALIILTVVAFLYITARSRRKIKRAKVLVDEKNDLLDKKNMEIMSSINYAQRISPAYCPIWRL